MLEACLLLRGYLVKTYELELKFFATFQTPAQAVEWCMLVQEAALLLPYDNDLLRHHGFKTKRNAQGRVVFRGPRLKMGVAAGAPTCIIPGMCLCVRAEATKWLWSVHAPAVTLAQHLTLISAPCAVCRPQGTSRLPGPMLQPSSANL